MRLHWRWGAIGASTLVGMALGASMMAVTGCPSAIADFPPPGNCNPKEGVCPAPGGAAGGVGSTGVGGSVVTTTIGAGGIGGSAVGSPVTGSVDIIASPDFVDSMAPFTGAATIVAYPAAGGMYSAPYSMGAVGATFDFSILPNGPTWFFVDAPNTSVISTFSPVNLPQVAPIVLPAVDQVTLQNIASPLPSLATAGVSPLASQIVLLITNAGVPYPGVAVTGATGGAVVVYDTGNGSYSDSATATGIAGTIILFNSSLGGMQVITLTDTTMKSNQLVVLAGQGAVTLTSFAWH